MLGDDRGGIRELLRGLELTLGIDDLGSPIPLRLGLAAHGPLDLGGQRDVFDLDEGHLHTPRLGQVVDDGLDLAVEPVTLGQKLIEVSGAADAAQGRLGNL